MRHQRIVGVTIRTSCEIDSSVKHRIRVVAILAFRIDTLICAIDKLGKLIEGSSVRECFIEAHTTHVTQSVRHLSYLRIHDIDEFLDRLEIVATTHEVTHYVRSAGFRVALLIGEVIEVLQFNV